MKDTFKSNHNPIQVLSCVSGFSVLGKKYQVWWCFVDWSLPIEYLSPKCLVAYGYVELFDVRGISTEVHWFFNITRRDFGFLDFFLLLKMLSVFLVIFGWWCHFSFKNRFSNCALLYVSRGEASLLWKHKSQETWF